MSLRTPSKKRKRTQSGSSAIGESSSSSGGISVKGRHKTRPVDGYKTDGGLYSVPVLDSSLVHLREAFPTNSADNKTPQFTIEAANNELIR